MRSVSELKNHLVRHNLFFPVGLADAIKRMGFVQADPIRSPARAQDLILRHRVENYKAGDLETFYPELELEEGYLYAYGFFQKNLWQVIFPKQANPLSSFQKNTLAAVKRFGSVHPKDLESVFGKKRVKNAWGGYSQKAKQLLEELHDHGHLRIVRREKGVRIYEIADAFEQSHAHKHRFKRILMTVAKTMGPTTPTFLLSELSHFNYLLPSKITRSEVIQELIIDGELMCSTIDKQEYVYPGSDVEPAEPAQTLRILTPFDPIVRDRARFEHLWGWTYRFEAYTPVAKRQLGYYAMPMLWRDEIIGWANAKVESQVLKIEFGYQKIRPTEKSFRKEAESEIVRLARFLRLEESSWEAKNL